MKRTFMAVGLALSFGTSSPTMAQAKTPPEVLEPYKAYRAAMKDKKTEVAADYAFDAWQAAEKMMGDTKTTGDLAANLAGLTPRIIQGRSGTDHVVKAFQRGIELAKHHEESAGEVELQRWVDYLAWSNAKRLKSNRRGQFGTVALGARIAELGLNNTTYEADYLALKVQVDIASKDWSEAENSAKRAIELYESVDDGLLSYFEYLVPTYLATAYTEQKKLVDAVLVYQDLIDKLEAEAGHTNAISAKAYGEWLRLRDEVLTDFADDPRTDAIKAYVVPQGRATEPQPLIRIPPQFPSGFLRGSKSGWVQLQFDISPEGRVSSPRVIGSSSKKLEQAALASLKDWRYAPNIIDERSKNITAMIKFDLMTSSGRRLDYAKPVPESP
jgi:TonB family protein